MRVIGRFLVIVALWLAVGLHWYALQSIAWTAMMIEYSREVTFTEALTKTLDGNHPCSLCHAVQTGRKSEQKGNVQVRTKIDFYCAAPASPRPLIFVPFEYPADTSPVIARFDSPPTPPPRIAG